MISLLMIYINRGLFVGIEIPNSSGNEINSLLEIIMNWAGGNNDVDEDGDFPETYSFSTNTQPLIAQHSINTIRYERLNATAHKIFYPVNESIKIIDYCKTIEHPPE